MSEVWKDIPGYEGHYQVSNIGRVKSLKKKTHKDDSQFGYDYLIMSLGVNKGYNIVSLGKNGLKETIQVHQLVAMAFLDHKRCGTDVVVDHINNIRNDNRLENLQLISNRLNSTKDKKNGGVAFDSNKKKWRSSILINGNRVFLGNFDDKKDALMVYNFSVSNIDKYKSKNDEFRTYIYTSLGMKIKKPKGCSMVTGSNDWMSCIYLAGKNINLGVYKTEQEASEIYKIACDNKDKYIGDNAAFRCLIKSISNVSRAS